MQKRTLTLLLLGLLFVLSGIDHGIWRPDEPRVAGICAEMARNGNFVVPMLNNEPFLEKPPLYFACGALAAKVFGIENDISYRLVSLTFGLLCLGCVFLGVSRLKGKNVGVTAALILASSWQFFRISRWIQVDIALVFGVSLCMLSYLRLRGTRRLGESVLFGLGLGIAFMSKGLVGPAIIAAAVAADMLLRREFLVIRRPFVIAAVMLVPVAIWTAGLYAQGGWEFVREVLVVNNIMRFTGAPEGAALGHQHGLFYYFESFPRGFMPWSFVFIPAFLAALKDRRRDEFLPWFLGPFLLLCLSSTKRGVYLAPLFPAAATMCAVWLTSGMKKWRFMVNITWVIGVLGCFLPFAGIFRGEILSGIIMRRLASVFFFSRRRSLVVVVSCALFCSMTVYYSAMKPANDYLEPARTVMSLAGDSPVAIVYPDEILEGVLPLVSAGSFETVVWPEKVSAPGLYAWAEKDDDILSMLESIGGNVLFEQAVGRRMVRLVKIPGYREELPGQPAPVIH